MADPPFDPTTAPTWSPERWEALASIFNRALARPEAERDAFLRDECPDPGDLAELRALLAAYRDGPQQVDRVMAALGGGSNTTSGWHVDTPRVRVGAYEILREIGRGGMGVVYLARRADGLYQRLVALKLARMPVVDEALRARFLSERDILASLAHPHIAPLFDGGVTEDGLPYFTMEYVDGLPIDAYCDAHRLDVRARIRLFLSVCGAVGAAHRALVVHRDLKPTNVLVTEDGSVKLLDFGIAKLLASDAQTAAAETATDARVLTPAYASPEQVRGEPVSTATDVYALGLLLYELLCGRRAHRFPGGRVRLEDVIVHSDPMPMADALNGPDGHSTATAADVARARRTTPARLARQLRGDLARITAMALRKDPEGRYPSAAHLADDLERFLEGRPIVAREHSLAYRAARFARRHRFAVVATMLGVVALAGYLGLAIQHARNMEQIAERDRQEAARAHQVAEFIVALFEGADPDIVQQHDPAVSEMLERGLQRADALEGQPQLQARLLNAIGRAYFNLGEFARSEEVAARALAISRETLGDRHPDVARDARLLGLAKDLLGKRQEAIELFRSALDIRYAAEGRETVEVATDLQHLGYSLTQADELDEAERYVTESLRLRRALLPPGHEGIAMSLSGLAFVRSRQGRPREAADLYREALAIRVARLGERHPEVARGRQNLAAALSDAGSYDEAAEELTRALAGYRAVYGERHPSIATALNNAGQLALRRGREGEAVDYLRAAYNMRLDLLGAGHPATLTALSNLAASLSRIGRLTEAERLFRGVLAHATAAGSAVTASTRASMMTNLAHILMQQGKLREAEAMVRRAMSVAGDRPVPSTEASMFSTFGRILLEGRRYREAVEPLRRAVEIRRGLLGPEHPDTRRVQQLLDEALASGSRR